MHKPKNIFRNKTIRSAKPRRDRDSKGTASGSGSGGATAKPISYDTYSTDTSSQFSVDIVEVAPSARGLELEETTGSHYKKNPPAPTQQDDGGESAVEGPAGTEIVLNASRLQVESEK